MTLTIGILALQGAFVEHQNHLQKSSSQDSGLGQVFTEIHTVLIRNRQDWERAVTPAMGEGPPLGGLILPGGESTTMGKLLQTLDLSAPIGAAIAEGLPVFGTCAGVILLAKKIINDQQLHWGLLDISVERNAYGRQLGSFSAVAETDGCGKIPMIFIRAPRIAAVGAGVKTLACWKGDPVAVQQGNILAVTFHPELSHDLRLHQHFVQMCQQWSTSRTANPDFVQVDAKQVDQTYYQTTQSFSD